MKTWHYIAIAGALVVVAFVFVRKRATSGAPVVGPKVGSGSPIDAGAPALPNISLANPTSSKLFTFTINNTRRAF